MKKPNENFRTAVAAPFAASTDDGTVVNLNEALGMLKDEITLISDVTEMFLTQTVKQQVDDFIEQRKGDSLPDLNNNEIARNLGIKYPEEFFYSGKSGRSRVNKMFGSRVVAECKSWIERSRAQDDTSSKYVSQGWKRTARSTKPRNLAPKINLGDADNNYSNISVVDDVVVLRMVVQGKWMKFYFNYDDRFQNADEIAKPSIRVDDKGRVRFSFPLVIVSSLEHFSSRYIVGVDVGITNYATVSVYDTQQNTSVMTTTLSKKVHSLANKVKKTNVQVRSLKEQGREHEAASHRKSNSRRKKELAIQAAQEIAHISHEWDNAIVVFEDLSWIENTTQNGRWNRGELVKRTTEQVEINGGRIIKTNCYNTSKVCCTCNQKVSFLDYHTAWCKNCDVVMDRDENAATNIAKRVSIVSEKRGKSTFSKMLSTRNTKKNKPNKLVKRSKNGDGKPLKHPGRDRTKSVPTPKRKDQIKKKKEVNTAIFNAQCSARHNDDVRVALDVCHNNECDCMTVKSNTKIGIDDEKAHVTHGNVCVIS